MEILEKYKQEIKEDLKIDQLNILEKQLILPSLKHKWVSRLIDQKRTYNLLNKKKKETKKKVLDSFEKNLPKNIPKVALDQKIENSEIVQKLNEQIEESDIIIQYLEKVEKIFSSMSFDLKNATDLIKMETT
jgi:phenylalanyl-tRNA synthetase alpha subunit